MHAGLSPDLNSIEQINHIRRPTDVPDSGVTCDLLWSDPDPDISGWAENDRGVSYTFGADVVGKFLNKHDYDLVVRAHQVVEDGYEFFADRQLVTIFSAPNYCGEFDNAGAVMAVDESLMCSFRILKPLPAGGRRSSARSPAPPSGGQRLEDAERAHQALVDRHHRARVVKLAAVCLLYTSPSPRDS